jgi:hypothetical protein
MWIRRLGEERLKFWGEKHHEITVVAPRGFEPVFSVRHALS